MSVSSDHDDLAREMVGDEGGGGIPDADSMDVAGNSPAAVLDDNYGLDGGGDLDDDGSGLDDGVDLDNDALSTHRNNIS